MIKYNPKNWFGIIFQKNSQRIFKRTFSGIIGIGVLSGLICYLEIIFPEKFYSSIAIHSLLGFVLSLFLVFRTNTAYDRWWEGRKQWGAMVNNCRNLALKINALFELKEDRHFFKFMIPNFVKATRDHLRLIQETTDYEGEMYWDNKAYLAANHKPNYFSKALVEEVMQAKKSTKIDGYEMLAINEEIKSLTDILGACERIKNTPIPYSYSSYIKKFIFLYVITLPFGLVQQFHFWTIPIVMLIFYTLVSIELIAEEIEDPFGLDDNDLPLVEITEKITMNVGEILA